MIDDGLVVVGLLSGGKDSCYNLCHCVKQGHKIAALATLAPPEGKGEHLNWCAVYFSN
jgi:diphthamide synthase (EF-2-diphthine--ammonia ligase)